MSQNEINIEVCYVNRLPHGDDDQNVDPGIEVFTEGKNWIFSFKI